MDVKYFVSDPRQMHKIVCMLTLILPIFHYFSVKKQNSATKWKSCLSHSKVILATKEVTTTTFKTATKVILAINKLMSAPKKAAQQTHQSQQLGL